MNRKVKVGVVGVGSLGQHHARIYSQLDGAELAGIFDVDQARAKEIASTHGTRAFASL
ncbi:MAG TPA: Gfo/Idh/MocA family oxidoreductase, partial [Kiritimatiellia bacterium]